MTALSGIRLAAESNPDIHSSELAMAAQIEPIVKELGGVSKAWVWVKMEPDLDRWRDFLKTLTPGAKAGVRAKSSAAIPPSIDILPGVNTDEMAGLLKGREQSIARRAASAGSGRTRAPDYDTAVKMASWFQRISVRIAVPETINPERLKALKDKLPVLIGLNIVEGDTLIVQTIPEGGLSPDAAKAKGLPARFLEWMGQITPNMALLWILLAAAIFFIFGPIRAFLRDAASAMQVIRVQSQTSGSLESQSRIKQEEERRTESIDKSIGLPGGPRLALGPGGADIIEGEATDMPHKSVTTKDLFAFVKEDIIANLIQICQEETPEHVAMIVSYIKPAFAGRILSSLPTDKRQDVLGHFSSESRFEPDAVTAFAERLKSTIYFVSGGPERLLELMEEIEPATRNAVLLELDRLLPETARIVRSRLVTYADLFRLDPKELQKLLWEAYRSRISLPILFASVSEKGQDYLIGQLPDSIAAVVREEVKTIGSPAFERIDAEGRRLLQLARTLEKSGDISRIAARARPGEAA